MELSVQVLLAIIILLVVVMFLAHAPEFFADPQCACYGTNYKSGFRTEDPENPGQYITLWNDTCNKYSGIPRKLPHCPQTRFGDLARGAHHLRS